MCRCFFSQVVKLPADSLTDAAGSRGVALFISGCLPNVIDFLHYGFSMILSMTENREME